MTVAEMIKQTRIDSGMTQDEYGLKFGVSRQTVSSWENERSLPDLQMLIDICNTYGVSLDKLLNEDKKFVDKIDFHNKSKSIIKKAVVFLIVATVAFSAMFIRWKVLSADANRAFADNAQQLGFVLEDGRYALSENDIYFTLPNQKLPFLKEDFFAKNSYADFQIAGEEINISLYDGDSFEIRLNHHRYLKGSIDKNGTTAIEETTLTSEENKIYENHEAEIQEILQRLRKIHNFVYS